MQLYLLSVRELLDDSGREWNRNQAEGLHERTLRKLDKHRLKKVQSLSAPMAVSQAIGAGLLLQLAVQRKDFGHIGSGHEVQASDIMSVSELVEMLNDPVEIAYCYDDYGKPDFADGNRHFNLSHSGEYVCLVTDETPVGVDIQQMRPLKNLHLAERYFSENELVQIEACQNPDKQAECFYRIWVQKEAYAKLIGEGIARTIKTDTRDLAETVKWLEPGGPAGYRIAICTAKSG